jgi:tetratricopeptide (TPR) repeat protein
VDWYQVRFPIMPERVAFLGNCQATSLADVFNIYIGPLVDQAAVFVNAQDDDETRQLLNDADIVVVQQFDFPSKITADALKPGARRVLFPMIVAGFYWPFASQPHINSRSVPLGSEDPYPAQLGDRFLNGLIAKGIPTEEAVAKYLALDVSKQVNLDRLVELHLDRQRIRDNQTGISTASFIEARFRDERIFLTPDHPELSLFKLLAGQVYEQIGVSREQIQQALAKLRVSPFPLSALPIHPSVIAHFGLRIADVSTRYQYHDEGKYTFEQYVRRYLNYTWNRDLYEVLRSDAAPAIRIAQLDQALALSPESVKGWLLRSELLCKTERLAEARSAAGEALALDPSDPDVHLALANISIKEGALDEATSAAERAIDIFPHHAPAYRVLSEIATHRRQYSKARDFAWTVTEIEPGRSHAFGLLGSRCLATNDLVEAESAFARAMQMEPHLSGFQNGLATVLERQGRIDEALTIVQGLIDSGTSDAHVYSSLSRLLRHKGDLAGAETAVRRAIALDPSVRGFRDQLADVLEAQGGQNAQPQLAQGLEDPRIRVCSELSPLPTNEFGR